MYQDSSQDGMNKKAWKDRTMKGAMVSLRVPSVGRAHPKLHFS